MKQLSNFDLSQNQLLNVVLQQLSSSPSSPKTGQIWGLTTSNVPFYYNGTIARPLDAAALTDGSIQIAALAVNPLNRANHTGTQLASTISNFQATVQGYSLSSFATATANIPMGGYTFTGIAAPTASGQAAEYSWVLGQIQSAAAGISSKPAVQGVYTSNVALSGLIATSDSSAPFTPTAGQRMLVANNTTASQNGPYIVSSGAWSRATTDGQDELDVGATWLVLNGGQYGGTQWRMSNASTPTVGTTSIGVVQFGAGNSYTAGNGLTLTGSAFAVNPVAGGGVLASASGVSIDSTVVARKVTATITGNGSTTSFNVTHNLGIQNVLVQMYDSSGNLTGIDVVQTSTSAVSINFAAAPASSTTYSVTVVG